MNFDERMKEYEDYIDSVHQEEIEEAVKRGGARGEEIEAMKQRQKEQRREALDHYEDVLEREEAGRYDLGCRWA